MFITVNYTSGSQPLVRDNKGTGLCNIGKSVVIKQIKTQSGP